MLVCRILCVLWSWLFIVNFSFAQEGDFFIKNYTIDKGRIENPFFSIMQTDDDFILVTNRSGILEYDGYRWERISCPGAVYSTDKDYRDFIVSGKFGFGYINQDRKYISLSDSIKNTAIGSSYSCKIQYGNAIFQTDSALYIYDINDYRLKKTINSNKRQFLYLLKHEEKVFVVSNNNVVFELNTETELKKSDYFKDLDARPLFINKFGNETIIGTSKNQLFLKSGSSMEELSIKDNGFLGQNIITSGQWLNEKLLAVGTLKGGIAFIDLVDKSIVSIANSQAGLTDNEVLGMILDKDQGLWVIERGGLDRIAPFLPVKSYNNYPGLYGNPVTAFSFSNKLYVATTNGVFLLKELKDYEEVFKLKGNKKSIDILENQMQSSDSDTIKKRGLFNFRSKRKKEKLTKQEEGYYAEVYGTGSTRMDTITFLQLKDVRNVYSKVVGIESKNSLFEYRNNHFINGGLSGIYEIHGDSAVRITREPVRDILISKENLLYASNLEEEILIFHLAGNQWKLFERIDNLYDQINHMYEDLNENVWMTGNTGIYKIEKSGSNYNVTDYALSNPYSDKTLITERNGNIYFINPTGYYTYNEVLDEVLSDSVYEKSIGLPVRYFGYDQASSWINNGEDWYGFANNTEGETLLQKTTLLSLIDDVDFISFNQEDNSFWVITSSSSLYKINNLPQEIITNYGLRLKEIRQQDKVLNSEVKKLEISEQGGTVSFEYVQPDYSGVLGIQYRYKLNGLENEWSDWSNKNIIQFPYLPPGNYTILVQSKDIFGQVNESKSLSFQVIPPYWEQPWFYAMEVIIFSFLLFLSIKVNRKPNARYMMMNRLLAFLTLILIVEYVQAIGDAKFNTESSPVIGFFIQVVIAAAILPLEQLMRKYLIGEGMPTLNAEQKKDKSENISAIPFLKGKKA